MATPKTTLALDKEVKPKEPHMGELGFCRQVSAEIDKTARQQLAAQRPPPPTVDACYSIYPESRALHATAAFTTVPLRDVPLKDQLEKAAVQNPSNAKPNTVPNKEPALGNFEPTNNNLKSQTKVQGDYFLHNIPLNNNTPVTESKPDPTAKVLREPQNAPNPGTIKEKTGEEELTQPIRIIRELVNNVISPNKLPPRGQRIVSRRSEKEKSQDDSNNPSSKKDEQQQEKIQVKERPDPRSDQQTVKTPKQDIEQEVNTDKTPKQPVRNEPKNHRPNISTTQPTNTEKANTEKNSDPRPPVVRSDDISIKTAAEGVAKPKSGLSQDSLQTPAIIAKLVTDLHYSINPINLNYRDANLSDNIQAKQASALIYNSSNISSRVRELGRDSLTANLSASTTNKDTVLLRTGQSLKDDFTTGSAISANKKASHEADALSHAKGAIEERHVSNSTASQLQSLLEKLHVTLTNLYKSAVNAALIPLAALIRLLQELCNYKNPIIAQMETQLQNAAESKLKRKKKLSAPCFIRLANNLSESVAIRAVSRGQDLSGPVNSGMQSSYTEITAGMVDIIVILELDNKNIYMTTTDLSPGLFYTVSVSGSINTQITGAVTS